MIDQAIANCVTHHICFCQKMRLEKAEWKADTVYKDWLAKVEEIKTLKAEMNDYRQSLSTLSERLSALLRRAYGTKRTAPVSIDGGRSGCGGLAALLRSVCTLLPIQYRLSGVLTYDPLVLVGYEPSYQLGSGLSGPGSEVRELG